MPSSKNFGCQIAAAGLTLIALSIPAPASAQKLKLVAGTLACKTHGSVGYIFGSKEHLDCEFDSAGGHRERYSASITKVGVDIGFKGQGVLVWSVLSSTVSLPEGALAGTYGGVSADAAVGIGGGANILVGGSNKSVGLQPVSAESSTGLNIALGVASLEIWRR